MTPEEAAVILHRDIRPLTLTVDEATAVTMAYEALIAATKRVDLPTRLGYVRDALRPMKWAAGNPSMSDTVQEAIDALASPRPLSLCEAAQALVEKLALIHADERYIAVWMRAAPYTGPNYITELNALRVALAKETP